MKNLNNTEVSWIPCLAYMPTLNADIKSGYALTMLNDVEGTVTVLDFEGSTVVLSAFYLKGQSFLAKKITAVDGVAITDLILHK